MTDKQTYLLGKHQSFQDALKSVFRFKILTNCDEESTCYFNKNLLTPAEFLNSLDIKLKPTNLNVDDGEAASTISSPSLELSFIDIEEFDNFDEKYIKLNLLKKILDNSPNAELLNKLEDARITTLSDFMMFINNYRRSITWYDEVQKTLIGYFNKSLKDLQFSLGYKPMVIVNILTYDNTDFEAKVQKKSNYLVKQYKSMFGQDIWENIHLSIISVVMFDISNENLKIEENALEKQLIPISNLVKKHQYFKIPINNPQKSKSQEVINVDFRFERHLYLKSKIQSYNISPVEKVNANNVRLEDRAKNLNLFDIIIIKDNIENSLNDCVPIVLKQLFTYLLTNISVVKKTKKKNFWSFFASNRNERNTREQDLEQTLMVYSFNLAELYFTTNNFELASSEFKSMVNLYNKIDLKLFVTCLEYYIYSLILYFPIQELYAKIDGITQKLMEYYLEDSATDVLKCNRLSCLVNFVIKIGKYYEPRKVEVLDKSYQYFELNFNKFDYNKEYGFLKPIFKEEYSYRLLVSKKSEIRKFLYNIIITADYYGHKLRENNNFLFTLYLYMLAFNFYQTKYDNWKHIIHFVTQTLSQYKESLGRYDFAIRTYIDFINTYYEGKVKKEGEESHLRIYFEKLSKKIKNADYRSLPSIKLFEISNKYDFIKFDEYYNNVGTVKDDKADENFRCSEFIEIMDKRFGASDYVNYKSVVNDTCLLFNDKDAQHAFGSDDFVRETFVNEDYFIEFQVFNRFNVI